MPASDIFEFMVTSLQDTEILAARLAKAVQRKDCVLLEGPVGAGKTAFARAFINAQLKHQEDVPSPTFTLVQTYQAPMFEIWHCDLYRLTSQTELVEIGLEEAFDDAVTIIEWPDRLGELAPKNALRLAIAPYGEPDDRRITIAGPDRLVRALTSLTAEV